MPLDLCASTATRRNEEVLPAFFREVLGLLLDASASSVDCCAGVFSETTFCFCVKSTAFPCVTRVVARHRAEATKLWRDVGKANRGGCASVVKGSLSAMLVAMRESSLRRKSVMSVRRQS